MILKVFIKNGCPRCPGAKEVAHEFDYARIYDLDEPDGLAEGAYHSVLSTPSLILVDKEDRVIRSWIGYVPSPLEIAQAAA